MHNSFFVPNEEVIEMFDKLKRLYYKIRYRTISEFIYIDPKDLQVLIDTVIMKKRNLLNRIGRPYYVVYSFGSLSDLTMVTMLELHGKQYFVLNVVLDGRFIDKKFYEEILVTIEVIETGEIFILPYEFISQGTINITGYNFK